MTAWKWVPVEPTEEMEKVYFETSPTETLDDFYAAIIAAAPAPDDAAIEKIAQTYIDCGDGSQMQFRFVLALGLIEQSKIDDIQDELTSADALAVAYKAIHSSINAMSSEAGDG